MKDATDAASARSRPRTLVRRRAIAVAAPALLILLGIVALLARCHQAAPVAPWLDRSKDAHVRAQELARAMTESELVHMVHGTGNPAGGFAPTGVHYMGYIAPIPRLRVPALILSDGPAGIRSDVAATALPAPIVQAASFDPSVARAYGTTIGNDARSRGQDLVFSPGLNLARNPTAGRGFEYFGEDPILAGTMGAAHVTGLQSTGVMATAKHFAANNQETNRSYNSSTVDERTLHELYEKAFVMTVAQGRPAAVMCAYNMVNRVYACGNKSLLIDDLRGVIGHRGMVLSDFPATWSPTDLKNGLGVELPQVLFTDETTIRSAIAQGLMSWDDVRARVVETLEQMFRFGLFDVVWDDAAGDRLRPVTPVAPEGHETALQTALKGAVLLRNDGILPLQAEKLHKVAVIGDAAQKTLFGFGSSEVLPLAPDSTLERLRARLPGATVVFASESDQQAVATASTGADVVIVVAGAQSSEWEDRADLSFPPSTDEAVRTAASRNKNVVVVAQTGGAVLMPWLSRVRGVLNVWYPGEAGGEATARLLFGEADPRGHLPITFPAAELQKPASSPQQYPGSDGATESSYSEGLFIGYRWYTQQRQVPLFPFGFGLSYTTFAYSGPRVVGSPTRGKPVSVELTVTNTGARTGTATPQVYVHKPSTADVATPVRELAGFATVELQPGQSKTVRIEVDPVALSIWDVNTHSYTVRPGSYDFMLAEHADRVLGTVGVTMT